MVNNKDLDFIKLTSLPNILEPNKAYLIKEGETIFTIYLTDKDCNLLSLDTTSYELFYDESSGMLQLIDGNSGLVISETTVVPMLSSTFSSVDINTSNDLVIEFKNPMGVVIDTLTLSVGNIQGLQGGLDLKEDKINKVDDLNTPNSTTYPTTNAVFQALDDLEQDLESQIGDAVSNSVSYDPQTKTPSEKQQARDNIEVYSIQEIEDFFNITTPINGYNKTNWDTAFSWGNHAGLYEPVFTKGNLIQGNGLIVSGTLTNRLVNSGDITITHDPYTPISVTTAINEVISEITSDDIGSVTSITKKVLNPSDIGTSPTFDINNMSTSLREGGVLTINSGDNSTFDISEATIRVVSNEDTIDNYTIPTQTGITPSFLLTDPVTYIGLSSSGIEQSNSPFTELQRRSIVTLGVIVHSDNTLINAINNLQYTEYQLFNQFVDFVEANKYNFINKRGNELSPNGINLRIDKSEGEVFRLFINSYIDTDNPHTTSISSITQVEFRYRLLESTEFADTQDLNPNVYDNGTGAFITVPQNKYTVQRVNMAPSGAVRVQPGQELFDTLPDALSTLDTQEFIVEDNIQSNFLLIGYIVTKEGVTDLSDERYTKFIKTDKDGKPFVPGDIYRKAIYNSTSTGILEGGILTVNVGDPTSFDITSGFGRIVDNHTDPLNPVIQEVYWEAQTAIATPFIGVSPTTYVYIDSNGNIQLQPTEFTEIQFRNIIAIGALIHIDSLIIQDTTYINNIGFNTDLLLSDLTRAIGRINVEGNNFIPIPSGLTIEKTGGESFYPSLNYENGTLNPNILISPAQSPVTFRHAWRDGVGGITFSAPTTQLNPDVWDDGTGTLNTKGGFENYDIKRVFFYPEPNIIVIAHGQETYLTLNGALQAVETEFFDLPIPSNAPVAAYIIVNDNTTDLTDTSDCIFLQTGKFGSVVASSIASQGNLQTSYDNSVIPQIVTSALGSFTIQAGVVNPDNIYEGRNLGGTPTFEVTGDGNITSNSIDIGLTNDEVLLGDATTATRSDIIQGSGISLSGTLVNTILGGNLTISHADTSSQASIDNSDGVVIQDITLDTFGHITSLNSTDLDSRYYTESELQTSGSSSVHWNNITNTPNTLSGYGITDAYTKTEADGKYLLNTTDTFTGDLTVNGNGLFSGSVTATGFIANGATYGGYFNATNKSAASTAISNTSSDYQIVLGATSGSGTGDIERSIGFRDPGGNISAAISSIDKGAGGALGITFLTGNATSISKTAEIDNSGNFTSTGAVEGNTIVKTGASSNDVLMGDGGTTAGASGSFTSNDGKTITVTNGIITAIV